MITRRRKRETEYAHLMRELEYSSEYHRTCHELQAEHRMYGETGIAVFYQLQARSAYLRVCTIREMLARSTIHGTNLCWSDIFADDFEPNRLLMAVMKLNANSTYGRFKPPYPRPRLASDPEIRRLIDVLAKYTPPDKSTFDFDRDVLFGTKSITPHTQVIGRIKRITSATILPFKKR